MNHRVKQHGRIDYPRTTGVPLINESCRNDWLSVREPEALSNMLERARRLEPEPGKNPSRCNVTGVLQQAVGILSAE
jgi:hypothetical protein